MLKNTQIVMTNRGSPAIIDMWGCILDEKDGLCRIMRKEQVAKITRKRTKISRVSVVDQVCAAIKQDIADGVWKSGDKIPSEA